MTNRVRFFALALLTVVGIAGLAMVGSRGSLATFPASSLFAQSIEQKKQLLSTPSSPGKKSFEQSRLTDLQAQLDQIYQRAAKLRQAQAPSKAYQALYELARQLHQEWEEQARELAASSGERESEAIWHLPEATVKQLVMDFGGAEAIYLIPEEIAQRKVALISSLSLPRQSWSGMLELILSEMGVGVRQLNPFCRELFASSQVEGFDRITDSVEDLWLVPDHQRVCLVMSPGAVDLKHFTRSLARLIDPNTTQLKPLGSQLAVVAPAVRLRQIVQIYQFMERTEKGRAYRIVSLSRLQSDDLQKMLGVLFLQPQSGEPKPDLESLGLQVFPIQYNEQSALFIAGSESEVRRAVDLVSELENQLELSSGRQLFWYTAKHVSPEDLAKVVSKVYRLLLQARPSEGEPTPAPSAGVVAEAVAEAITPMGNVSPLVVSPSPVSHASFERSASGVEEDGEIVVDAKSGSLVMVVDASILSKLKELIARLDTPKKMVRIDFLLFEKKTSDQTQFGLEQLKMGSGTERNNTNGLSYSTGSLVGMGIYAPINASSGISHFFASYKRKRGIPSFDLAYNFLLSQEGCRSTPTPQSSPSMECPRR